MYETRFTSTAKTVDEHRTPCQGSRRVAPRPSARRAPSIAHRRAAGSTAGGRTQARTTGELPRTRSIGFRQRSTSRRPVDRRPSARRADSPAIGAPFGNGSENPPESARIDAYPARASRGETPQFAGRKRRTTLNQVLLAMQKVVGSSPISRLESPANGHLSRTAGCLRTMQKVLGSNAGRPLWRSACKSGGSWACGSLGRANVQGLSVVGGRLGDNCQPVRGMVRCVVERQPRRGLRLGDLR
jgi:hypothetical protein